MLPLSRWINAWTRALAPWLLLPAALTMACAEGKLKPRETTGDASEDIAAAGAAGSTSDGGRAGGGGLPASGDQAERGGQAGHGAEPDPRLAFAIPSDGTGWVDGESNDLGIQGQWSTSMSQDSSLEWTSSDSEQCLTGVAAQALGDPPDRVTYWGVAARLDLCSESSSGPAYTLGTCPWADRLDEVVGVRFSLTGTLPREVRVVFLEPGRDVAQYVQVRQQGDVEDLEIVALFEDAYIPGDTTAAPVDPTNVDAVEFVVSASSRATMPFDFCIQGLEVLTGEGWRAATIPDWALEPGPGRQVKYAGVNLAGAEFGAQNLPGTFGVDYIYPRPEEIDYYADAGMNVIRLPFRWERLEPTLGEAFDNAELERIEAVVDYAGSRGMSVVLDPHNFARYGTPDAARVIGEPGLEASVLASFWGRLAALFADNERVFFGLMNEPHDLETEIWVEAANAAIAAIREAGAENLILVPGNGWTGAHNWAATYYGTANSVAMTAIVDPVDHFAFELHQYLDADFSGRGTTCSSGTVGVDSVQGVTEWLREGGYQGFLGEFGAPVHANCMLAMDELLLHIGENADVWMGWAVWAGGPWWGENALSVEPLPNGNDRPQMVVLRRHLTP